MGLKDGTGEKESKKEDILLGMQVFRIAVYL